MISTPLDLDVQRMTTLASKWGNIPRSLLAYIDEEDQSVENIYRMPSAELHSS